LLLQKFEEVYYNNNNDNTCLMAFFQNSLGRPIRKCQHSGFIWVRTTQVVVTTGAIRHPKLNSQIISTNIPTLNFLQAGYPSCHPTNSVRALKGENILFHRHAHPPSSPAVFHPCLDH